MFHVHVNTRDQRPLQVLFPQMCPEQPSAKLWTPQQEPQLVEGPRAAGNWTSNCPAAIRYLEFYSLKNSTLLSIYSNYFKYSRLKPGHSILVRYCHQQAISGTAPNLVEQDSSSVICYFRISRILFCLNTASKKQPQNSVTSFYYLSQCAKSIIIKSWI